MRKIDSTSGGMGFDNELNDELATCITPMNPALKGTIAR